MSTINETPVGTATAPVTNPQTADAQAKIASLRIIAADFPDEVDPKPLTKAERRLANVTTIQFMEKAVLFAEASPGVGGLLRVNALELREAIASDLAAGGVIDESKALTQRMENTKLRKKLKAAKIARGIYRVAKGFVTTDLGTELTTHVLEMKRTLTPRRKKAATKVAPATPVVTPEQK